MFTLYPKIKPYKTQMLKVDDIHELYIEEVGDPKGIPILVVHGGPGAGCDSTNRRYFDPDVFRIILFDQRGCGRSLPYGELENNTTQHLIEDIETIRQHLGIEQWLLFGGSWGATLSLVYAQQYAEKVMGLILRGVFLCRQRDIDWFYQEGASHVFPDYWGDFVAPISPDARHNMVAAYHKLLHSDNELARTAAARAWSLWEGCCATLHPNNDVQNAFADLHLAVSLARIECHYFMNHCFLEENQIIKNVAALKNIPGIIVHGRYDMVCPLDNAWQLHEAWPQSELNIIRDAGHSAVELGTIDALVRACRTMAKRFQDDVC